MSERGTNGRGKLLTLLLPTLLFATAGLVQAWPLIDTITPERDARQDWLTYRLNAVSILDEGWTIPRVDGPYRRPGGFGYNYFIAAIFALTGRNATHVYLVQSALAGLSAGAMIVLFGPSLGRRGSLALAIFLVLFLLVDVQRHFSILLLSENLLVAILPLTFGLTLRLAARPGLGAALAAGVVWGLAVLVRPNVFLVPIAITALLARHWRTESRGPARPLITFLLAVALGIAPIVVRDAVVTGRIDFAAITWTGDWQLPRLDLEPPLTAGKIARASVDSAKFWGRRTLYAFGFTNLHPVKNYRVRWHWVAMWAGAGVFVAGAMRGRPLGLDDSLLALFLILYLVPIIAVGHIHNYAIRMMLPALPAALVLSIRGWTSLTEGAQNRSV